jgi:ferredoxin
MSEVHARVDDELCVGTGVCEATAPDLFEVGDDGVSHVLVDSIPADRLEAAREAAANCPTRALKVE